MYCLKSNDAQYLCFVKKPKDFHMFSLKKKKKKKKEEEEKTFLSFSKKIGRHKTTQVID
jgi:hypothetical protein